MALKRLRCAWLGAVAIRLSALVLARAHAEDTDPTALAAALKSVPTTLEQGLRSAEKFGKPISAKFEIEDGKLRLSVCTIQNGGYDEVIVGPGTGVVSSTEKITDADDLKAATSQKAAMEKATVSLMMATENAAGHNAGSLAVSIVPELKDAQPIAAVTVLRDGTLVTISEKLN